MALGRFPLGRNRCKPELDEYFEEDEIEIVETSQASKEPMLYQMVTGSNVTEQIPAHHSTNGGIYGKGNRVEHGNV